MKIHWKWIYNSKQECHECGSIQYNSDTLECGHHSSTLSLPLLIFIPIWIFIIIFIIIPFFIVFITNALLGNRILKIPKNFGRT